jgi:hypothetical protein
MAGMSNSQSKRELAAEQRKLDHRKDKLMELAGVNAEAAFRRVRLIHDQERVTWLEAYDTVIAEVGN